jgi:predicted transcriptional regulator YdeE
MRKASFGYRSLGLGLLAVAAILLGTRELIGKDSGPKVVKQDSFTVVGVSARTTNAKEATADGVIGKQWGRLMQEGLLAKIPNKADGNIVAVYTDYASDKVGEYTYLLGAKVKKVGKLPEGLVAKTVPAGKYVMFTTERGPSYKVVPQAWQKIDALTPEALGGARAYGADFEIYDERARSSDDMVADVYVGIK